MNTCKCSIVGNVVLSKKKALTVQSDRDGTNRAPGPSFVSTAEAKLTQT